MQTAPLHINKDDYTGKHTLRSVPKGSRVTTWTAAELSEFSKGKIVTFFEITESRGQVECITRTRFISDSEGNLHGYNSDGTKSIIHPAGRQMRILSK